MSSFEWDEEKNEINISKHGIDFNDAHQIFKYPILARVDDRRDYKETRWIGLGILGSVEVVVVYTKRGNIIRLISIRKANKQERRVYHERIKN